jgi:hypothetical protein
MGSAITTAWFGSEVVSGPVGNVSQSVDNRKGLVDDRGIKKAVTHSLEDGTFCVAATSIEVKGKRGH